MFERPPLCCALPSLSPPATPSFDQCSKGARERLFFSPFRRSEFFLVDALANPPPPPCQSCPRSVTSVPSARVPYAPGSFGAPDVPLLVLDPVFGANGSLVSALYPSRPPSSCYARCFFSRALISFPLSGLVAHHIGLRLTRSREHLPPPTCCSFSCVPWI